MPIIVLIIFAVLGLVTLAKCARIVAQYERGLVMRLGKYKAMAPSGLTFLVPFIEELIRVDMREKVINVEPQKVITKDNVTVIVDAVVYYKVIDPVKAEFLGRITHRKAEHVRKIQYRDTESLPFLFHEILVVVKLKEARGAAKNHRVGAHCFKFP